MIFSYSVIWHPSDVAWASRWDSYLRMSDVQIHWFAICNSVAIVLFLSGKGKHSHVIVKNIIKINWPSLIY